MKQYLEWLEKQIDFCLEDETMQREHWAFCRAFEKFKSLETTTESEELTPHIEYYSNGNVMVKGQLNSKGQREGLWEWFYKNGNIGRRTPYKEGKFDGIDEVFYENGNILCRTPYKGGKEDGIEEWFYENGNIHLRIPYKEGKRDGIEECFYSNGNIRCRTTLKEGKRDGIQEWFNEQGIITETLHWKNRKLIKTTKH